MYICKYAYVYIHSSQNCTIVYKSSNQPTEVQSLKVNWLTLHVSAKDCLHTLQCQKHPIRGSSVYLDIGDKSPGDRSGSVGWCPRDSTLLPTTPTASLCCQTANGELVCCLLKDASFLCSQPLLTSLAPAVGSSTDLHSSLSSSSGSIYRGI